MISFKQFINEEKAFDLEQFKKDCSYALSLMDTAHLLYRGIGSDDELDSVAINKWYERLGPLTTNQKVHDAMNKTFKEMFGHPIRNWMFCSGQISTAREYADFKSNVYAIFPIGKFEWVCSKNPDFSDMTGLLQMHMSKLHAVKPRDIALNSWLTPNERLELIIPKMIKLAKESEWWHNKDLKQCIASENEIMVKCDRYYRISITSPEFKEVLAVL